MDFISITTHAKEKSLRRFGFNSDKLHEFAQKSVTEGYSINDAPSNQIRKYLKGKKRKGQVIYCYNSYVFVFSDAFVLITAYPMPLHHLLSIK